jgi:hypothetical protein
LKNKAAPLTQRHDLVHVYHQLILTVMNEFTFLSP